MFKFRSTFEKYGRVNGKRVNGGGLWCCSLQRWQPKRDLSEELKSDVGIRGRNIPGTESSRYKGPGQEGACWRNSQGARGVQYTVLLGYRSVAKVVSDSLWPHGLQHASFLCPSLSSRVCSHSCPLNQWCCLTVSSSAAPFSFCFQSLSQHQGLFQWVSCLHQVAEVLELRHQSFQWMFRVDFL